MRPEILQGALRLDQREAGFSVEEEEDGLVLCRHGKPVHHYGIHVKIRTLRADADVILTQEAPEGIRKEIRHGN